MAYLWLVDHISIKNKVWSINQSSTIGVMVTPYLPIEEAVFFLLVNCMIVFGILAVERTFAAMRLMESRVGGRGNRTKPISKDVQPQISSSTAKWTITDEILLWIKYAFLPETLLDQETVKDLEIVQNLISVHSKTFSMASMLYPQPIREDLIALYGFCRITDDIVDTASCNDEEVVKKKTNCVTLLKDYITACYATSNYAAQGVCTKDLAETITLYICEISSHPQSTAQAVLRLLSARIPRTIPMECLLELLDGHLWDLNGRVVITEDQLIKYSNQVASSVGEACLYLMSLHDLEASLCSCVQVVNNRHASFKPSADMIRHARDMGVALQLTNILRDLITDAEDLGRTYIPSPWFALLEEKHTNCSSKSSKCENISQSIDDDRLEALRNHFIASPSSSKLALKLFSGKLALMSKPFTVSAEVGIKRLPKPYRFAVKCALAMYLLIGKVVLEAEEYPRRGVVPLKDKCMLMLQCLLLG
ncbi:hypothetical protein HDU83_001381 [Entophlyctis luteolus]|nr:hypothetical protein HDU83_001381 [Entophlyctis luteolus]KAJ3381787.1 hypothetical protein HDU84_004860 [Entophlyctis sp. JEL0112]